ncbi:hypothetical protein MMC26_002971 [Xylographa opegraphella]|nr:hypothetical protein [Xylographa opegraphella]
MQEEKGPTSSTHSVRVNYVLIETSQIKCNRLRPTCEACTVFQCTCIYDAIPKKRGPKTDVLEALLKRVDGLEKKLQDKNESNASARETSCGSAGDFRSPTSITFSPTALQTPGTIGFFAPNLPSHTSLECSGVLIDAYFVRVHDKPFHILDEATVRELHRQNQVPNCLRLAICSLGVLFVNHGGEYAAAVRLSEEYASHARKEMDMDDASLEGLQTLLLLHRAFFAAGKGPKSYMLLATAVGMALALDLHREVPSKANVTATERELRRQVFWTCYLMDRFTTCGTKRPSLLSDKSMLLRLPSWSRHPGTVMMEGEYFQPHTNLQYAPGVGRASQGPMGILIDITRILGITDGYLARGGVKGDSHFPWHSMSNLSKIRLDLDAWALGNPDLFIDNATLVSHSDGCALVLSKMIYHLIHCLVYRPFLPVDLAELRGTGQHQSWQIEATHLCFLHANAIGMLAEAGRLSPSMEWPAFTGYCLVTAGTVHVHGAHYKEMEGEVYSLSAQYLSQELQMLSELRMNWASAQHQKDTLQHIYHCHTELVKSLASNPMRYSPVFHLEDFYDRYPGQSFDGANVSFTDVVNKALDGSSPPNNKDTPNVYPADDETLSALAQSKMPAPRTSNTNEVHGQRRRYTDASVSSPMTNNNYNAADVQNPPSSDLTPSLSTVPEFAPPFNAALQSPMPTHFSPSVAISPLPQAPLDPMFGMPADTPTPNRQSAFEQNTSQVAAMTPGECSQSGSTHTNEAEQDPFLSLLEQLAENEYSQEGPSDLDFYLGRQEG